MRISDWSSDVCSSDLLAMLRRAIAVGEKLLKRQCNRARVNVLSQRTAQCGFAAISDCFKEGRKRGGRLASIWVVQVETRKVRAPIAQNDSKPAVGYVGCRQVFGDIG